MEETADSCDDEEQSMPLVLVSGSSMFKGGFAGDDAPRAVFPSIVGRPKHVGPMGFSDLSKEEYVGDDAQSKRGILRLKCPIERSIVSDWDGMESIWHHTFYNELRVEPENCIVLLTEAPVNPRSNRERMMQIMFETFRVQGVYVAIREVLSLFAQGLATGCVLNLGSSVTYIVPIYESEVVLHAVDSTAFGGKDLTDFYVGLAADRGYSFTTTAEREIARDVKETLMCVALDFDEEIMRAADSGHLDSCYEHPCGNVISVGSERLRVPEALFQPSFIGREADGIHTRIFSAILKCGESIREQLFRHIVLSGGSSLFPGIAERMEKELHRLAAASTEVNVIAPPGRKYSAWIGGSMFASLPSFTGKCMRRSVMHLSVTAETPEGLMVIGMDVTGNERARFTVQASERAANILGRLIEMLDASPSQLDVVFPNGVLFNSLNAQSRFSDMLM